MAMGHVMSLGGVYTSILRCAAMVVLGTMPVRVPVAVYFTLGLGVYRNYIQLVI